MIIKKITMESELDSLVKIDEESFKSSWDKRIYFKMLNSRQYELFGVYQSNELSAFICVTDTTEVLEILRVAVASRFRKQGHAMELLKFLESNSQRDKLFLEVRANNKAAISLYNKFGFEKITLRKNYYKDTNEDAVIMKKNIITLRKVN